MPIQLDAIDRRILENLQRDGRLTNLELADRIGLSPTPCLRRVRRLEAEGYIHGYGARLDRRKLGLALTAFVAVNIERHSEQQASQARKAIAALPEVISCYITSGEHDFLLQVVVPDLEAFRDFTMERLLKIAGIKDIRTSFAYDVVKENASLPLRHLG
jgi:Lrp/AsnC family leucine-responsive transcriptional regulator